jgi:hypothetical protein
MKIEVKQKATPRKERTKGNMDEGKDDDREARRGRTNKKKEKAAGEG